MNPSSQSLDVDYDLVLQDPYEWWRDEKLATLTVSDDLEWVLDPLYDALLKREQNPTAPIYRGT